MVTIAEAKARVYPVLISLARAGKKVTYGELWKMAGFNPRWRRYMGQIPGEISEVELAHHHPPLSAIVINENSKYPGGGFLGLDCTPAELKRNNKKEYAKPLSDEDKAYVTLQQEAVWKHWGAIP